VFFSVVSRSAKSPARRRRHENLSSIVRDARSSFADRLGHQIDEELLEAIVVDFLKDVYQSRRWRRP
jgi:hypothetical protein